MRFLLTLISSLFFLASFAHANRPIRGTYEVPVKNGELAPYSIYDVKFKADTYEDNPEKIDFPMPATLVGVPKSIEMNKSSGLNGDVWVGPNVQGLCKTVGRYFTCNVRFSDLQIDSARVDMAIRSSYTNPEEIANRTLVARAFEGEPIGIIRYKLRGRDRKND